MKSLYFLLIILFVFSFSNAQIVDIPDANFKNVLVNTNCVDTNGDGSGDADADINDDGEIQVSEAEAVLWLSVGYQSISSLEGIQSFTSLEWLYCQNNELTNLDLSQNHDLVELFCFFNQLTSLDVTQNPNLYNLLCFNNQITSLDVSQNPILEYLFTFENQLTSLDISQNPILQSLNCHDNQLTSLNIKNGINFFMSVMRAENNNSLNCIEVDDEDYANSNPSGWDKDDWAEYREECILGIEDNTQINFTIYPIPAQDVLNIESQQQIETVKIYNLQGQLIKTDTYSSVDVSQFSSGLYFVQVAIDGQSSTKRFIKE